MDTLLAIYFLALFDNAYKEITEPPPQVVVEKLTVPKELYYPDLTDDMWDPNWINKKT